MSVVSLSDPTAPLLEFLGEMPERCFWCSKPLIDPVVHWHGCRGNLWLHRGCATELALQLIYEARRAEAVAIGQSLAAGVEQRLLAGAR